jgi:sarcosine oxidase subunit beta
MTAASVVVIGAGVVGASVAYHLAARGWRDVRILERAGSPGAGSTRFATGGFRSFFSSAVHVRLSLLSLAKLRSLRDETGIDSGYRPAGYLWLAAEPSQMDALRQVRALHAREGGTGDVELDAAGIARLNPAVARTGLAGGLFCPSAGFLEPRNVLKGYLGAAMRQGVRLECDAEVVGFERNAGGRIEAVRTPKERIAAEFVVDAAGPWAAKVAQRAGVALPVTPLRRQVAVTRPFDRLPAEMPMTVFLGDGFHLRVRDGRVLLLMPSPGDARDPFDTSVDPAWLSAVYGLACRRMPALRDTGVDPAACYAGLYEMSPDGHALLGPAPDCENLVLANGSSGHGVMHAPALGQLVAEILTDGGARSLDVDALRPSRFGEGRPNPPDSLL